MNHNFTDIARRYARTWFAPDVTIVSCDWVSLLVASSASFRAFRFAKLGRFLRLLAMIRLLKVAVVLSEMIEQKLSDTARLVIRFGKILTITMFYAHIVCCVWFWIGRVAPADTSIRWIDTPVGDFVNSNLAYQYFTSFHWAMCQITLGAMEVPSVNTLERIFSVFCLGSGLIFGSTIISALSAAMLESQIEKQEANEKMKTMRQYLRERKVDRKVAVQIEKMLAERLGQKDRLREEQVTGLQLLSSSMQSRLRYELFGEYMQTHSFFTLWINIDISFVHRFCSQCFDFIYLRSQDDLFTAGKTGDSAYFFISGNLTYAQHPESSPVEVATTRNVSQGSWLSEAAMWSHWIHVGTIHAPVKTEVAAVRAEKIQEVMQRTVTIIQLTRDYCKKFHRRLQAAKPPTSQWPDDLHVPSTEWGDMVASMDMESQIVIGLDAIRLAALGKMRRKNATGLETLSQEVEAGKSTVMMTSKGEMERLVSLVAVKIYNDESQVFLQIGKREKGELKAGCQLPGVKQDRGELVSDTMERLLETKMAPIADHVEVTGTEREVQWKDSKEYGVRSKYMKDIVKCRLPQQAGLEKAVKIPEAEWIMSAPPSEADGDVAGGAADTEIARQISHPEVWTTSRCMRPVYYMEDNKGGGALYGWFTEQEFDQLKGQVGDQFLPLWVKRLTETLEEITALNQPSLPS